MGRLQIVNLFNYFVTLIYQKSSVKKQKSSFIKAVSLRKKAVSQNKTAVSIKHCQTGSIKNEKNSITKQKADKLCYLLINIRSLCYKVDA